MLWLRNRLHDRQLMTYEKAKVEVGVQVVERWILARLRTRQCFSLAEVNDAIAALLTELNQRPFKKLPGNRASAFAALDQPLLKPLPTTPFELARWKKARVSIDYHVDIKRHYYSVPHQLVGELLEVRITASVIECLHHGKRVASHVRSGLPGRHTTQAEHMPKSHRAHLEWTPGRLLNWALSIGPATRDIAQYQLESRPHPEMGYRACLGLMRLARQYSAVRLELACVRARALRAMTYRSVAAILKAGLEQQPLPAPRQIDLALPAHANVRGSKYYH
jgi:transposase